MWLIVICYTITKSVWMKNRHKFENIGTPLQSALDSMWSWLSDLFVFLAMCDKCAVVSQRSVSLLSYIVCSWIILVVCALWSETYDLIRLLRGYDVVLPLSVLEKVCSGCCLCCLRAVFWPLISKLRSKYILRPKFGSKTFAQRNDFTFWLKSVLRPNFSSARG